MDSTEHDNSGGVRADAPLQVLVVSPPSPIWGAQVYLLDTVAPLLDRGVQLTLATPPGSPLADAWLDRGFPLLETPVRLHAGLRRRDGTDRRPPLRSLVTDLGAMVPAAARLGRLARGFDVVHSYALRSHLEVGVAARFARRPAVLDLVDIVRPGIGRTVLRTAVRLATLTVANSAATAATVASRRSTGRVRIIQPGIDLARFRPGPCDAAVRASLTSDPDAPLVAIIGRIDRLKGIQYLVEAMGMLEGPAAAAHLAVVGDAGTGPPEFARELRIRAEEVLGDRVRFTGRRSDVPDIVRSVDAVVNASKAEPFGLSVLEAQACGTVVIGTDAGGIPEFVEHGVTGLLVPPFEAPPLAVALQRVLTDCALVASMTAEAVRRAHPARGLDAQYDELAAMYRSVARPS